MSRIVMRLRGLISDNSCGRGAEEVSVLSWALADMADYIDDNSKQKLKSEPVIGALDTCFDGAASHAYRRISESLQTQRWE